MTLRRRGAVIGLGAIGSMALWRLADRGAEVHGYEASTPGHDAAAYGGRTRAYHVASYGQQASTHLDLIRQALPLWRELEIAAQATLVDHRGDLAVGAAAHADIDRRSSRRHTGRVAQACGHTDKDHFVLAALPAQCSHRLPTRIPPGGIRRLHVPASARRPSCQDRAGRNRIRPRRW